MSDTASLPSSTSGRLERALASIDLRHAADPTLERDGEDAVPAELLYARRMSAALQRLRPEASEAVRLAVRCQHLERWTLPRSEHSAGRGGYLRWRQECARRHAALAGELLAAAGYGPTEIERVRQLVRKRDLRGDPEAQALEDAACLVFLEHGLGDFAARHAEEKVLDILGKTWRKMSPGGREAALALPLAPRLRRLVDRALESGLV